MESKNLSGCENFAIGGPFLAHLKRQQSSPSVIVIGGGISGTAAARSLANASFKVILLESRNRLGGRVHTDYSFGYPVDMGASWLHGVCNENSLAPLIRGLGLRLYRTSGDNSVLYDHDLESYALFDTDGNQVPQQVVIKVGEMFERILKETEKVRDEHSDDMSVFKAISIVQDRHPELRQEGLAYEVLQWYICRMEAWFAADADDISLKSWDQYSIYARRFRAKGCASRYQIHHSYMSALLEDGEQPSLQKAASSDWPASLHLIGKCRSRRRRRRVGDDVGGGVGGGFLCSVPGEARLRSCLGEGGASDHCGIPVLILIMKRMKARWNP